MPQIYKPVPTLINGKIPLEQLPLNSLSAATSGTDLSLVTTGEKASWNAKANVSDIPTTVSQLTNDSGYLTTHQDISGKVSGPSTSTDGVVALWDGTTGKLLKDSSYTIASSVPANAIFTDHYAWTDITGKPSTFAPTIGSTATTAAAGNHTHSLSMATDSGTNAITLAASTKYKLTAGGSTYIFTTPPNTTYSFTDKNVTLAWGTKSTIATVGGTDIHVTMPSNPNTDHYAWNDITGKPSSYAPSDHNHGTVHNDFTVTVADTTTDSGWSMISSTYVGFILKSIRFQGNSPSWGVGAYGAGIAFGGYDTKGIISVKYNEPGIKIAGGNGTKPVWYINITGTSGKSYNLNNNITNITRNGTTFTATKADSSTFTFDQQDIEKFFFPTGSAVDITSSLNTSGASYTVDKDCVIMVRYYNGFCEVEGNSAYVFSAGSGINYNGNSTQPSRIKIACKAGAVLKMWLTATVLDVTKRYCR